MSHATYRIRFHGRGGQGIKTASRVVGTAFFRAGYETQDCPRYGAERRGAPIAAYVRAAREPILERGAIRRPGLVLVADASLLGLPAADVLDGITSKTTLFVHTTDSDDVWRERLALEARILTLPRAHAASEGALSPSAGIVCAGVAARLTGVIDRRGLEVAVEEELAGLSATKIDASVGLALEAFEAMAPHAGSANPTAEPPTPPDAAWIELPFDPASVSAPIIRRTRSSEDVQTGLWRKERPVIDEGRCTRCWWLCHSYCPDGAITVTEDGRPHIDYAHCKGCMICLVQCPPHAISMQEERA